MLDFGGDGGRATSAGRLWLGGLVMALAVIAGLIAGSAWAGAGPAGGATAAFAEQQGGAKVIAAGATTYARKPSRRGRRTMRRGVRRSNLVPQPIRQGKFKLRRPRVSTKAKRPWARATIVPTVSGLDPALGLFKWRRKGKPIRRWRLVAVGTVSVGCPGTSVVAPRKVRRDLRLTCP